MADAVEPCRVAIFIIGMPAVPAPDVEPDSGKAAAHRRRDLTEQWVVGPHAANRAHSRPVDHTGGISLIVAAGDGGGVVRPTLSHRWWLLRGRGRDWKSESPTFLAEAIELSAAAAT